LPRCVTKQNTSMWQAAEYIKVIKLKICRNMSYRKYWNELVDIHGARCYYCHKEPATTIDHVIPYDWDEDNNFNNLVPSCNLCNRLASDMVFEDVEQKRRYILTQRRKRSNQIVICTECLIPYTYRVHCPTMFICAECYDIEYGTEYSKSNVWKTWISQLSAAGIPIEAHRKVREKLLKIKNITIDVKVETLIDEYAFIFNNDPNFARMLIYS